MSDKEMREQKASLLLELDEAETQVNHIREKATRVGRAFQSFGSLIEHEAERVIEISSQNSFGEVDLHHFHPPQVELLDVKAAFSVTDELRKALRTLRDLEQRVGNLGMRR